MNLRFLFYPLAQSYGAVIRLRNWLYSNKRLHIDRLGKPVISVGNLTMGGTGKTPTVIALGRLLAKEGLKVSVLLRGYKGQHTGGPLLVSDGKQIRAEAWESGDEALVIARNLPSALVTVGKNRARTGTWVEQQFSVDVHLLDDGYQHRRLHRNLNLLLFDVTDPFGGGYLPPLGYLREPLTEIQRADAVILTRVQEEQNCSALQETIRDYNSGITCFKARQRLAEAKLLQTGAGDVPVDLKGMRALAFAGIAQPQQFFDLLESEGARLEDCLRFPDHHRYTSKDVAAIEKRCRQLQVDAAITTEKDVENLRQVQGMQLRLVVARNVFEFEKLEELRTLLLKAITG